jgi:superfamily II DNA or RNA helicase
VSFNGTLREEQVTAASAMLKHNKGNLSAATAFGKNRCRRKDNCRKKG